MDLLGQRLDAIAERKTADEEADDAWLRERAGIDPDARRASWRRWLCRELEKTLQWPSNDAAHARLIGQCAAEITVLARQLRGRGWLLEGKALAEHVRALLAPIAAAQRASKIGDFWPYFCAAVRRYVGAHAEEIQAQARRSGAEESTQTFASALSALGIRKAPLPSAPTLTEVLGIQPAPDRQTRLFDS